VTLLILGLGNDLLGDDAVGLRVAERVGLERLPGVETVQSSAAGLYLIDLIEGQDDAIVIDSLPGDPVGSVLELDLRKFARVAPSAHYAGLPEALRMAEDAGTKVPRRVAVVAVTIRDAQTVGAAMDPAVEAAIPKAASIVRRIAGAWGYAPSGPAAEPEAAHRRSGADSAATRKDRHDRAESPSRSPARPR